METLLFVWILKQELSFFQNACIFYGGLVFKLDHSEDLWQW